MSLLDGNALHNSRVDFERRKAANIVPEAVAASERSGAGIVLSKNDERQRVDRCDAGAGSGEVAPAKRAEQRVVVIGQRMHDAADIGREDDFAQLRGRQGITARKHALEQSGSGQPLRDQSFVAEEPAKARKSPRVERRCQQQLRDVKRAHGAAVHQQARLWRRREWIEVVGVSVSPGEVDGRWSPGSADTADNSC